MDACVHPNLGCSLIYGVSWAHMDPKFGVTPRLWVPVWTQIWGVHSFMGCPGPVWTPNLGYPSFMGACVDPNLGGSFIYGVPWAIWTLNLRYPSFMGACLDPNLGGSFFYGVSWPHMDPKFGISLHLWGTLGPYGP